DTVRGTEQYFRIMGLEPTDTPVPMIRIRSLRPTDDRERVSDGYQRALEQGQDVYDSEFRIRRPDGALRVIFGRGRVVRDGQGNPLRYSGIDIDITDRKGAEEQRELLHRELQHRILNTLVLVSAMVSQTMRDASAAQ